MDADYEPDYYIQPWTTPSEFMQCYETMFVFPQRQPQALPQTGLDTYISSIPSENLLFGLRKLLVWQSRNDNKTFALSSFLLVDSIIKIKKGEYINSLDVCHILAEKIIRVTNLLIDELKKTKKTSNANMFLVAKDIDLPEYIIETRHACTHKNLPSYDTLLFAIKFLFVWVKQKMWDKQYALYTQEQKYNAAILAYLKGNEGQENFTGDYTSIHLEIDHLMDIIVEIFKQIKDKLRFESKSVVLAESIDGVISVYQQLQITEGDFCFLMSYLFISQQMLFIIKSDIEKKDLNQHKKEIEMLIFFAKIITKYFTPQRVNYQRNSILIDSIHGNILRSVRYSPAFTDILNSYLALIKDHDFDNNKELNIDLRDVYLYRIGEVPVEDSPQPFSNDKQDPISEANIINNEDTPMNCDDKESAFIQEHPNTLIL